MRQVLACLGWIAISMAAGLAAALWPVNSWYMTLTKPSWNPPNWIFGPVWTTLYVLIGISAWRVWRAGGFARDRRALVLFAVQWIFNFGWTGFFFGMQSPGLALIEIAMLWVMIGAMIVRFARHDRVASALLVPYAMWVSFAMMLNAAIWQLNS